MQLLLLSCSSACITVDIYGYKMLQITKHRFRIPPFSQSTLQHKLSTIRVSTKTTYQCEWKAKMEIKRCIFKYLQKNVDVALKLKFCFMLLTALCEDREEPWPWFQHLRRNQWTREPIQALGHGKTISLSVLKDRA